MLKGLLSKNECAQCRICCCFDSGDLWEIPVFSRELADRISSEIPEASFSQRDGGLVLDLECQPDEDLYICSMLDCERGCVLGDKKPFDCRIWPFRIMSFNDARVITVSPVCPVVSEKPLKDIMETAENLSEVIFHEADKNPSIVKPYIDGYPIIITEKA